MPSIKTILKNEDDYRYAYEEIQKIKSLIKEEVFKIKTIDEILKHKENIRRNGKLYSKDDNELMKIVEQSSWDWFKENKENNKFMNNSKKQAGNQTYKKSYFNKMVDDNKSLSADVVLLLDESDDKKTIICEVIATKTDSPEIVDSIFNMFVYAYLHNKKFLTKKIEKFGFLYSWNDDNIPFFFEYKSDKLTMLLAQLNKKINEKEYYPITFKQRLLAWVKNNATTMAIVCSSSGMVSLIGWLTK